MRTLTFFLLLTTVLLADAIDEEQATERFAERLLEFARAWRKGETSNLRGYLGKKVKGNVWPNRWNEPGEFRLRTVRREVVAADLVRFARMHGAIEYLSLKPYRSLVLDGALAIEAKLEIVGVGPKGERRWTRGRVGIVAYNGEILQFRHLGLETRIAIHPPFTEVGIEAGLTGTDPPALEHPTLGLAAFGAAAADVDGDGDIDLFSTGHHKNTLYVNEGNGKYAAISIATPRRATGPLFLDFDNDGDPDLFCSANGKQMLLENRGNLNFVDISEKAGVAVESIGFTATAGDINGDRVPDIYVAAYNNYGPVAPASWDDANNGLPNLLFVSNGDGTYTECAKKWGVAGRRWSYSAQFLDVDGDGRLDLYVANDFGAGNRLFLQRDGSFVDAARKWGVLDGGYGMGVDFGDYDNDGILDLYVTKMSSTAGNRLLDRLDRAAYRPKLRSLASGNSLYRGLGKKFEDVTNKAGPFHAGWSWGAGFIDIDNDGYEDLYSPNGHFSGAKEKDT